MPEPTRLPLRLVVLSTVVALAAAVGTYAVLADDDPGASVGDPLELTPADDLPGLDEATFTTYEGEEVRLASLRGTPLVVNFFASTCAPCVKEMPALEEVHQELGDAVAFLGLAVQDRPEAAQALVERTGVTYRTALDKDGSVLNAMEGIVLPTTVLIDVDGVVVARSPGELTANDLRALVAEHFGPAP